MIYRKTNRMPELKFSILGFGCWSLGNESGWTNATDKSSTETIRAAIEYGVTFFDTAPVYGFGNSESLLGRAIKTCRDKLIIATKCGLIWDESHKIKNDLSETSVLKEIDKSLKRLSADYIDIYQLHWPDHNVRIEDLQNTLHKLLESKKVRYIGLSNFSLKDTKKLSENKKIVSYQGLYNILEQNENGYHGIDLEYKMKDEILPFCKDNDMAVFPYSPLMQGILTDNFDISKIGDDDVRKQNPKFDNIEQYLIKTKKLKEYAAKLKMTLLELTYGWLAYQKEITSIISGATNKNQIIKNAKAANTILREEEYNEINNIALN